MKRFLLITLILAVACSGYLQAGVEDIPFIKGISYLLLNDKERAQKHLEEFFKEFSIPGLRSIFISLINENSWEVTKQFNAFLDNNHRSLHALIGIALSTAEANPSTSMDNLDRAIRLNPNFPTTYICLGMQYQKQKNYPMAKLNFQKALRLSNEPECKMLLCQLHLLLNEPNEMIGLIKPDADRNPDDYYANLFTAQALFLLKDYKTMEKYITAAVESNPTNPTAQLLMAKYLLQINELKQAKTVLKKIQYSSYHEDYAKTMGHVLLLLKDKQAKAYLDEVFSRSKWDKEVNWLLGLYLTTHGEKGNVQNWVNRAILSGTDIAQLQRWFPKYQFPQYQSLPFFSVSAINWISNDLLLVAALKNSGERQRLYILQAADLKTLKTFEYDGTFKEIFFSKDRKKMIFSTDMGEGELSLYALEATPKDFLLRSLYSRPIKINSILAGFNNAGDIGYITHSDVITRAFDSPFAITNQLGEKKKVYPNYPFPVYKYNFQNSTLSAVKDDTQMEYIPIDGLKKYFLVYNAMDNNNQIRDLIERGEKLDITSSEIVKIFFSKDLSSFIIYLSDLKNAFQAKVVDNVDNKTYSIDETMFLGQGQYAELNLLDFDPEKKELLVLTKGGDRTAIHFNYRNFLYTRLASKVLQYAYDKTNRILYFLTERSKKKLYTETTLSVVYLKPYFNQVVDDRRNLERIAFTYDNKAFFNTLDGELVEMDGSYQFHYITPSFEGCIHSLSMAAKKCAAFINGNLYIVNVHDSTDQATWATKQNLKK